MGAGLCNVSVLSNLSEVTHMRNTKFLMKTTTALCLLIIFSTLTMANAENNDYIENNLGSSLFYVREKILWIEHAFRSFAIGNSVTIAHLSLVWGHFQSKSRDILQEKQVKGLNKTRADVDAANSQGRDTEYCFTSAVNDFTKIKTAIVLDMHNCIEECVLSIKNGLNVTNDLWIIGNNLIKKLGSVVVKCLYHAEDQDACTSIEVKKVKPRITSFQQKYVRCLNTRETVVAEASGRALSCLSERHNMALKEIASWMFLNDDCVKGAE